MLAQPCTYPFSYHKPIPPTFDAFPVCSFSPAVVSLLGSTLFGLLRYGPLVQLSLIKVPALILLA